MVVDLNISRNSSSREWFGLSRGVVVVCAMVLMGCVSWCVLVGGEEVGALRSAEEARAYLRGQTTEVDRTWLREVAREHLEGCRLEASDGTLLFSPDGSGHYKALWTRDFRYMVRYAGDLIDPELVRGAVEFLLRGQRRDGCMPDRVTTSGEPIYSPGSARNPLADHALDNGPFMALLVCEYVALSDDLDFFREHEAALRRGLDFIRRSERGLVYNDPENPQCPYGFTDTVAKTGNVLFSSLLYYEACVRMHDLALRAECGDPEVYQERAAAIDRNLELLWDGASGMFFAADKDCRQIDVWGSALAVELGVTSSSQAARVISYLEENAERIFFRGQVRHLPQPELWSRMLVPIGANTYQNGAYWSTPHAWLLPVLARGAPDLAARLLSETIRDFRERGVHECVGESEYRVPKYVASITNVYGLVRE